jgi:hypothetical protein
MPPRPTAWRADRNATPATANAARGKARRRGRGRGDGGREQHSETERDNTTREHGNPGTRAQPGNARATHVPLRYFTTSRHPARDGGAGVWLPGARTAQLASPQRAPLLLVGLPAGMQPRTLRRGKPKDRPAGVERSSLRTLET